jgi:hypothetical protein
MNILKKTLILAGCVSALGLGCSDLMAQVGGGGGAGAGRRGGRAGGGAFNPQAMLDTYRRALGVTDDTEWSAISAKITAVTEARTAAMGGRGAGGCRGSGAGGGAAAAQTDAEAALQKAVDDKAPSAEIKTKIAAVRAERQTKQAAVQAAYVKAQDELRALLTARQEAILTLPIQGVFGGPLLQ